MRIETDSGVGIQIDSRREGYGEAGWQADMQRGGGTGHQMLGGTRGDPLCKLNTQSTVYSWAGCV